VAAYVDSSVSCTWAPTEIGNNQFASVALSGELSLTAIMDSAGKNVLGKVIGLAFGDPDTDSSSGASPAVLYSCVDLNGGPTVPQAQKKYGSKWGVGWFLESMEIQVTVNQRSNYTSSTGQGPIKQSDLDARSPLHTLGAGTLISHSPMTTAMKGSYSTSINASGGMFGPSGTANVSIGTTKEIDLTDLTVFDRSSPKCFQPNWRIGMTAAGGPYSFNANSDGSYDGAWISLVPWDFSVAGLTQVPPSTVTSFALDSSMLFSIPNSITGVVTVEVMVIPNFRKVFVDDGGQAAAKLLDLDAWTAWAQAEQEGMFKKVGTVDYSTLWSDLIWDIAVDLSQVPTK